MNPRLTARTKTDRDADCVVGFYHFLRPGDIIAQAGYFVRKAPGKAGDILVVDWEATGDGTHAGNSEKDRFIREVKRLRPDHRVFLCTDRHFRLTVDTTSYAGDGVWIADCVTPGKPPIQARRRFHLVVLKDQPVAVPISGHSLRRRGERPDQVGARTPLPRTQPPAEVLSHACLRRGRA